MTDNTAASGDAPLKGSVIPYLQLARAAEALEFYKRAFGGEEVGERACTEDGQILNSRIDINGSSIMLMDPLSGQADGEPNGFNLNLMVDDPDRWFDRSVEAGCEVVMPMALQFWGDRYGMVKDPFGVTWAFAASPA